FIGSTVQICVTCPPSRSGRSIRSAPVTRFTAASPWRWRRVANSPTCCASPAPQPRLNAQSFAAPPPPPRAQKSKHFSSKKPEIYFFDGQGAPHGAQAPTKSSGDTARPLEGLER